MESVYVKDDEGNVQISSNYNGYPMYEDKEEDKSQLASPKSSSSSSNKSS